MEGLTPVFTGVGTFAVFLAIATIIAAVVVGIYRGYTAVQDANDWELSRKVIRRRDLDDYMPVSWYQSLSRRIEALEAAQTKKKGA